MDLCFPVISAAKDAITSPEAVSGVERGSLTVQCRYDQQWETHKKWWCRGATWSSCKILVKTTGSEQTVKMDRVSIRDDQKNHMFTVTMEDLRRDDADTYWCGIERTGTDLGVTVKVTIDPGVNYVLLCMFSYSKSSCSNNKFGFCTFNHCEDHQQPTSDSHQSPHQVKPEPKPLTSCSCWNLGQRSLLSSVHFLLLVFLEVPLLLGMVGAVLWVNRS
ncbi:CMRF35-like molecule 5 [Cynocephalus volans]|uniref:CMRF35-like molecule 5 n=1 Tax=Cynocephalus volans TaxID=110931 RepID=UPI002FC9FCDD